jgi:hypothetical protein
MGNKSKTNFQIFADKLLGEWGLKLQCLGFESTITIGMKETVCGSGNEQAVDHTQCRSLILL